MKPSPSKEQLLMKINLVSFAIIDTQLFLDTHPDDAEALNYLNHYCEIRKEAMRTYASHFGPLTLDCACDECDRKWKWVLQPWPWEGGCC